MRSLILALLCMWSVMSLGQTENTPYQRVGSFYAQWGYNRSHYNDSKIHFKGEGFDFTLSEVSAHDDPSPFEADIYLNPSKFSIPQFDFRVGYFIKENTSISLGWDHMKYVVQRYQRVRLEGTISTDISEELAGTYSEQGFDLRPSFLKFEHTDGLNFIRLAIEQHQAFWQDKRSRFHADVVLGVSAGPVLTWTDATFSGTRYDNWLHMSGWGVSAHAAARFRFKNTFYLQYQHQTGYMHLGDILFMENDARASQDIRFNEQSIVLGAQLPLFPGKNPNK